MNITNLTNIGELQIISISGSVYIDTLESSKTNILTENTNIHIRDCKSAIDIASKTHSVTLGNTYENVNISTTSGDVEISSAFDDIAIATTSGSIYVMEYYASAVIDTIDGNISMYNKGEENGNSITNIHQDSGNINITSLANSINITSNRNSTITITLRSMPANRHINHNIFNTYGTTNISMLMTNTPFQVRAVGSVSGELANNVIMSSNNEYILIEPPGYVGGATEFAELNVEGGIVNFSAIYE
jgi:DUF4097 and DUF4098 domain-containing protein YvlB